MLQMKKASANRVKRKTIRQWAAMWWLAARLVMVSLVIIIGFKAAGWLKMFKSIFDASIKFFNLVVDELFIWMLRGAGFMAGAGLVLAMAGGK